MKCNPGPSEVRARLRPKKVERMKIPRVSLKKVCMHTYIYGSDYKWFQFIFFLLFRPPNVFYRQSRQTKIHYKITLNVYAQQLWLCAVYQFVLKTASSSLTTDMANFLPFKHSTNPIWLKVVFIFILFRTWCQFFVNK